MTRDERSFKIVVETGATEQQLGGRPEVGGTLGHRREQLQIVAEGMGGGVTYNVDVLLNKSNVWRRILTAQAEADISVVDLPGINLIRLTFSAGVAEGATVILYREAKA